MVNKIMRGFLFTLIGLIFSTGCRAEISALSDPSLSSLINTYLSKEIGISGFDGEVYCAFDYLQDPPTAAGEIYIWALCLEFYGEPDQLQEGSGISLPVALQIQEGDGQFQVTGHLFPGNGSLYGPDVKEIFPASTWGAILPVTDEEQDQYNLRANRLMNEVRLLANQETKGED